MSGKQEIGISDISEFFGITPEAIRKYEGKGIVQVKRDENNKYRKYTMWELFSMLYAKRLNYLGFTLGQASESLKELDGYVYIERMEELQQKLAEEVAWKRKLIILLDKMKKERCSIEQQGDQIQIEYINDILLFEIAENLCLNTEENIDIRSAWIDALPFIKEYVIFSRENTEELSTCFAISSEDARIYGLGNLQATRIIPEGFYATCILKGDEKEMIMEKKIHEVACRIEKMGHRITDEVYAEIFDYAKVDGMYEALHKCYFPVEI